VSTLRRGEAITAQRAVIATYCVLYVAALGVALSGQRARFWEVAAVVMVIFGGLLIALLRRRRWAWGTLVVVEAGGLIVAIGSKPSPVWIAWSGGRLLLLTSPQMRRYVKRY
jgi:hypothetical protein